uniref:Uncharacterized protein n=1 Tax=viral metagenome TaxID=1070528 RepID=A0A6C0ACR7_9ZZZZ
MVEKTNLSMDGRENLYAKLFLPETKVAIPEYNNCKNADSVIRCKNYFNKTDNMSENDIHNDFTDYVIRTAVAHKNLDRSAEAGTRLQSIRDTISRNSKCMSYSSMNGGSLSVSLPTGEQFTNSGKCVENNSQDNNNLCKKLNVDLNNVSELESTVLKTLDTVKENSTTIDTYVDSIDYAEEDSKIDDFIKSYKNRILSNNNILDTIDKNKYDILNKDMAGGKLNNGEEAPEYVKNSYFNDNGRLKNMKDSVYSLDYLLRELENSNSSLSGIKRKLNEPLKKVSNDVETSVARNTIKTYLSNLRSGHNHENSIHETFKQMSKNMPKYGKLLENNVMSVIKNNVVPSFPTQHFNVESNDTNRRFFNDVVKNYSNLPLKTQNTYSNLFDVLKTGQRVDGCDMCDLKGGADIRINLRKVTDGSNSTVFEQFIPEVENADKIHYTDASGQVRSEEITQNENSRNILKDLYRAIFNGKNSDRTNITTTSGTVLHDVPNTMNNTVTKDKFDINVTKIVKDIMNNKTSQLGGSRFTRSESLTDLVTGELLTRDENGDIYTLNNSEKCYITRNGKFTDYKKPIQTGGSSKKLFQCLLEDDSQGLEKCLSEYSRNGNNNSKQEINQIHPLMALRTLQKFGFKTQNGGGIEKVEDVNSWMENFMKKQFSESQLKTLNNSPRNRTLMNYLNSLSNHVNSHPSILNQGFKQPVQSMSGGSNPVQTLPNDGLIKLSEKQKLSVEEIKEKLKNQPLFTPYEFMLDHVNSIAEIPPFLFLNPYDYMEYSNVLVGGACEKPTPDDPIVCTTPENKEKSILGADNLKDILNESVNMLASKGKKINTDDLDRLREEIQNIGENEKNILKRMALITTYADCLRNFSEYQTSSETLSIEALEQMIEECNKEKLKLNQDYADMLDLNTSLRKLYKDYGVEHLWTYPLPGNPYTFMETVYPEKKEDNNVNSVQQGGDNEKFILINGTNTEDKLELTKEQVKNILDKQANGGHTMSEAEEMTVINQKMVELIKTPLSNSVYTLMVSPSAIDEIKSLVNLN